MEEYRIYYLPDGFTADRTKWTKKQADIYFKWFIENKSERISYFLNYFDERFDDHAENDIKRLSQKLYDRISKEDCSGIKTIDVKVRTGRQSHEIRHETVTSLTDMGIAIASDFGIVFSFILEKNIPGLFWVISKQDKRTFHYKAPVLMGFRKGQSSSEYDPIHEGISNSSVMLNYKSPAEWSEFYKTIIIRWNRKTPTLEEMLERQRQGKPLNIEDIQKERGRL